MVAILLEKSCSLWNKRVVCCSLCRYVFLFNSCLVWCIMSYKSVRRTGYVVCTWITAEPSSLKPVYSPPPPLPSNLLLNLLPGAVARSEASKRPRVRSPRTAHSFVETWSWKHFYGHSPSSADSRRAAVSYWRKNVHYVLVNCLGGLPRNNVARLTDRAQNDLKCVEGP